LSGFIAYSTDLFDSDRIVRLVGHFQTLLAGIVANSDARLADLPLLTAEEQQTLDQWGSSPALLDQEKSAPEFFHHIFEAQVQAAPDTVAIVSEQESLTYAELNQRADRLAQLLQQMGVQSGCLVGLCVDRSADMVIGILGILKAGAAYVPLDPSYPRERLQFMLSDTQVAILLTQSWLVPSLPPSSAKLLCLDQLPRQLVPLPPQVWEDLEGTATTDSLAYVIYTSGSTGTPKGVLLSHRGLCNVVEAQRSVFQPSRGSRVLQFSSLSFDASIFEVALALGSGGTLYIPPKPAQLPGMALVQFLEANAITHALLTPAVLAVLPTAKLPALQVLITGGEACSSQTVDRWAANRRFFNAYGPTEITIWATVAELDPGDNPLTIGRPILNTQVYILDDYLNSVPIGIPGELYISGTGLARGYLNRSELTAERFIQAKGTTLYKTGDRAVFWNDRTIEFLGRVDQQIKIRGFRVELGEIEATLQRHPTIQDAAVLASGEASDMRLIAYFSPDRQQLRQAQQSLQTQQIQHWQTLYNQTYDSVNSIQSSIRTSSPVDSAANTIAIASSIQSAQFNITGWNSSYTGAPIPLEQMQEWVSDRVEQILALKPKRVLEIGCGTGLLLFQLAPHCQTYVATDFSTAALDSIQAQLNRQDLPQVELLHRMATDLKSLQPAFDVVILNSIVQYFPSVDYLMQVLEQVIPRIAPGGVLFVGDVRSLPLLTAFHTWIHFSRAEAGMEHDQLQQQVERSRFEEPELVIDPAFFHALRSKFPRIQQVQIRLSRGHAENEMTQFRYNVLLHFDKPLSQPLRSIQQHDWKLNPVTSKEIENTLIETKSEILTITNIKNRRVNAAVKAANWLQNQEAPKTVGRMRELLQNAEGADSGDLNGSDLLCGIDPQHWWDLETTMPYSIEITWSAETHTGDYDVLLIRDDVAPDVNLFVPQSLQQPDYHCIYHYANEPLQSQFARQLIPQLRQHLRQTLPDYMLPAAFVPLESLPLTASGKVNRRALPLFDYESIHPSAYPSPPSAATIAPSISLSPIEVTLVEIWKDLLRLKQVNIHENFFELGGHSLLATQMTSRVRDALGLELPLQSVFTAPTIAQLAPVLETLSHTPFTSPPPLVRLDRTAYRRKQTTLTSNVESVDHAESLSALPPNQELEQASAQFAASRSPLVPLTLADSKQPFFCVHPMFGVVFPYLELAHQLGSSRSFYGLQPLGLDGKQPPLTEIAAMAAYYIRAIQTLQPQGPYFLGGWSFGGLVAFEMAQQLIQAGQKIALLAILDTPAPQRQPSFFQNFKFLLGTALWSTLPFLLDYGAIATQRIPTWKPWIARWQWSEILRRLPQESQLRLLDESAIPALLRIVYANSQAAYRYTPQPYPDRITLFKATESVVPDATESDASLGWRALAGEIQVHQVSGNHLSLLKQPHVQTLAQQLRPYLF
jgi:amino acid adenylation domain-containing protein